MAEPNATRANAATEAEAILLNRNLARCEALRQCSKTLRKNPCACTGETFPCRLDRIEKKGCEIRFSCKELDVVVPGKYTRGPDLICENLPPTLLERLRAATNGHLRETHATQTCDSAADLLVGWLNADLRKDMRRLPRTEMISFLHSWGSDLAHLFGITDPARKNEALLRDCTVTMKDPLDSSMASMNLLDKVWLRLQQPE
jgi:hypothetical protein